MAIDYKKSGRRNGMSDAEFTKAMEDAKAFFAQSQDLYKKLLMKIFIHHFLLFLTIEIIII